MLLSTTTSAMEDDFLFITRKYNEKIEERAKAWEEGWAKGWTEGWKNGRAEAKKETAMEMKKRGLDLAFISEVTKLPLEEIQTL
jgi:predicted transposase/invertase (TIGR01784 family)